jgi:hypothetical protein
VRLAVVDVKVERSGVVQQPAGLQQARLQERKVILEGVAVARLAEQAGAVAPALEAGAIAVGVGDGLQGAAGLGLTRSPVR